MVGGLRLCTANIMRNPLTFPLECLCKAAKLLLSAHAFRPAPQFCNINHKRTLQSHCVLYNLSSSTAQSSKSFHKIVRQLRRERQIFLSSTWTVLIMDLMKYERVLVYITVSLHYRPYKSSNRYHETNLCAGRILLS